MKTLINKIVLFVFSKVPLLRLFDGYKRLIGNILIVAVAVIVAFQNSMAQAFPAVDISYLTEVVAFIGVVLKVIGDLHSDAKNEE